ncbi:ATP synthase mitochondrial F1 complex assembly factor 1 [Frankliniella occidentalis]|uniref:ATP synthase mitochondrial F1 complex assembly factor 1 n=1 Tax=Frankliniella occidentalis TaxID=133901 RepID=A0A6J1SUS0_FRAOC|nr:ATP synthase mitochondrial F1 complex assembly factor 1 [Frankliniella occidentalis]
MNMSVFFRFLLKRSSAPLQGKVEVSHFKISDRFLMTSPTQRAKEAVDALKGNPYLEKYAKKIAALQKTSPEELLSRLEAFEKERAKSDIGSKEKKRDFSTPAPAKSGHASGLTKPKLLSEVMKTDLLHDKTTNEIKKIWEEYHKIKDVIAATIPADIYDKIYNRSLDYPTFLLPLPRSEGYEFIVCQFASNEIHFTPLISYQAHKENAPECMTITHFTDLKESNQIVLMKGEFNKDILNVTEAQCLANQIQLYYGQDDEKRLKIMDQFTNKPLEFKHMDLIARLESLSL